MDMLKSIRKPWSLFQTRTSASPTGYEPVQTDDHEAHVEARQPVLTQGEDGLHEEYRDAAAQLLLKLGHSPSERTHFSSADNDRVLRRIDLALLPLMLAVYFLHALDKATLSYASVFGLIDDTGLQGAQFSWLSSVIFLAQLIFQLPVAWALVKLPIGTFTSAMVLGWGVTLAVMTSARSFPALLGLRFLLGAFEASVGPSFVAISQMWWRRREQTMRIGSWYCMNGLTWVFGSLITYGLASIDSVLKPYQIIFLFFGLVTIGVSGLMFVWMPDSPAEATFLSDNDKVIAIERLRDNHMGIMTREWRWAHVREAIRDKKTWLWVLMIFCASVPSNGIGTFGPLIIQSFVSDPFQTMLFNVPVGFAHALTVTISSYASMKLKKKGAIICALTLPPIAGLVVLLRCDRSPENRGVLLGGFYLLSTFTGITPLIYSWSAQNTAGDTKRKTVSALVFIGSSIGNIVGPLLFTPGEGPDYSRGLTINVGMFACVSLLAAVTMLYIMRLNDSHKSRRRALGKGDEIVDTSLETAETVDAIRSTPSRADEAAGVIQRSKDFSDATDLENEDFVFVL